VQCSRTGHWGGYFILRRRKLQETGERYMRKRIVCNANVTMAMNLRRVKWKGYETRVRDREDACRVLVGKPERNTVVFVWKTQM
jgi:hypothetical protein